MYRVLSTKMASLKDKLDNFRPCTWLLRLKSSLTQQGQAGHRSAIEGFDREEKDRKESFEAARRELIALEQEIEAYEAEPLVSIAGWKSLRALLKRKRDMFFVKEECQQIPFETCQAEFQRQMAELAAFHKRLLQEDLIRETLKIKGFGNDNIPAGPQEGLVSPAFPILLRSREARFKPELFERRHIQPEADNDNLSPACSVVDFPIPQLL